ncbi:mucin-2 [Diachasmimorpha longicaudata]|uniref:mucin-2 n=1 Tax=Diachasmimorpha longicaudata TaxID=58733 RepID=UPI0030B8E0B8
MYPKGLTMAGKSILGFILLWGICQCATESYQRKTGVNESTRIFSPRMDYEWTPLGRGDPLKNDPTFDYVPPVLDRVQYWLGDTQTTEPSSKRDVLVLGVTAKKTSPQIPEHFLKFMETQKFPETKPGNYLTRDFTGSTGAEPPKLIRTTKFRSGPSPGDFKHSTKEHYPLYPETNDFYYSEKEKPYTMMLPPPLNSVPNNLQFGRPANAPKKPAYDSSTTISSISFEKSNLIYHQSSHQAVDWPSAHPPHSPHRPPHQSNPPLIPWPQDSDNYEPDHHHTASSMNHEIIVGPNANIIVDGGDSVEDKDIVVGHKSPELNMSVILANTSTTPGDYESKINETVSVVMPTNYNENTTKSISSGTRTSAEMTTVSSTSSIVEMSATTPFVPSTTTMPPAIMDMSWQQDQSPPPMFPVRLPPKVFRRPSVPHRPLFGAPRPVGPMMMFKNDAFRPTTVRSPLSSLLQKEVSTTGPMMTPTTTTTTTTTTMAPTTTTVTESFTTDPIFSHYKQPVTPLHGPPYLIIQGHSKVKTYKPTINKHGTPLVMETTVRPISKFEQFVNENTRRMESKTTTEGSLTDVEKQKRSSDSLVNLVEKGISAFTVPEE